MPAIYAHLRFGEEVAKVLPQPYAGLIKNYTEAFSLGTQGPDILFYHHPLKKKNNEIRKRGTYLHTFSGNTFFLQQAEKLLENAKTDGAESILQKNGAFAAYTCGFLCHFTLDTICHPYIDGHSTEAVSHGKIESEFDKYLLRQDGKPIRGYNTSTPILDQNGTKEAAAHTLDVPEESIAVSIRTMQKINGFFSHKCEAFHTFAHFVLKIGGMERKFGDMFLHKKDDPLCEEPNKALTEKFRGAISKASALIQAYFENARAWVQNKTSDNELFRYNFSGIIKEEC